ncbi:MAG: polysaccharide deacetylase family protein [Planctomycetota bacterium]
MINKRILWFLVAIEIVIILGVVIYSSRKIINNKVDYLPSPIIIDVNKEKPLLEWFCYSDDLCDAVVLTFDDGPYRRINANEIIDHTGIILDILKRENIKATFFILGIQLDTSIVQMGETYQKYCEWIKQMFNEGHTVAIHDRNHISYFKQNKKVLDESLNYTGKRIREITGQDVSFYVRSPGGSISFQVEQYLADNNYKHVFWHINPESELHLTTQQILNNFIEDINKGKRGIILMHDRTASEYLQELIRFLEVNRIRIVSLEEWDQRYGLPETPHNRQLIKFD